MRKKGVIVDVEFKIPFLVAECRSAGIGILLLQELKLKGDGRIARDGYTLIFSGHSSIRKEGVGVLLEDCYLGDILEVKAVSSRIMWIVMKRFEKLSVYFSLYAPTNNYPIDAKESFYSQVDDEIEYVMTKFGRGIEVFIGGDLNARISNDSLWSHVRGNFINDRQNENGLLFLEFCMRHNFKIMNTFFQKTCYGTWAHPRNKKWVTIDYIVVSNNVFKLVMDCGVNKSFDIFSDHRTLEIVVRSLKKRIFVQKPRKVQKLDYSILATNEQLCNTIGEAVDQQIGSVDSFEKLFGVLHDVSVKYLPKLKKVRSNKDWFDANKDILRILVERKKIARQSKNIEQFRILRVELQRECRRAQSRFWNKIGVDMQELYIKNKSQLYFESLKATYGNSRSDLNAGCLLNLDGSISKTTSEIKKRWNEHFYDLLNQSGSADAVNVINYLPEQLVVSEDLARDFSLSELCIAIDAMKNNKAVGVDQIPIEFFKWVESSKLLKLIVLLFNKSLHSGQVDSIIKDVIISILFKKGSQMDCNNYRGLSLIAHLGKVLERLVQNRLGFYVEFVICYFPESQNGFRRGRSTVDSIFCSRLISSYCREKNIFLIKCFIDLTKAYDKVDRKVLWLLLGRLGVPAALIELIKNIHDGSKGRVKVNGDYGEEFFLSVGLKQGSIFAPLLFNIYFTAIIRAIESRLANMGIKLRFRTDSNIFNLKELQAKTKISYYCLLHLLYADDCAIMANSAEEMQIIVNVFDEVSKVFGQLISVKKTEILNVTKTSNFNPVDDVKISDTSLKVVSSFKYVGSTENNIATMDEEIKIRIQRMAMIFSKMSKRVFLNKNLSMRVKFLMFEVLVLSAGLYGCATWNSTSENIHDLEVWHQRAVRKILKIKWFDHISFFDIVHLASKCGYRLVPIELRIRECRLRYLGHVERMENSRLPKILLHAECDLGKRDVGQPALNYRSCIKKDLLLFNISVSEWQTISRDRNAWRQAIHQGKNIFLSKWWKNWFKKYNARRQRDKSDPANKAKIGNKDNADSLLNEILFKDEMIPRVNTIDIVKDKTNVSLVKRITAVNSCLEDMFPLITQEYQFDLLDQAVSSGRVNVDRKGKYKQNLNIENI